MARAYYNEFDPAAAAWLRELIARGLIAHGDVDERSIVDVQADDLVGYTQCHFFAGIGGWSYALRLAGWPDDRPVWTGSCPCQPFSNAGKRKGTDDERHLWPEFARLIGHAKPEYVFGEQVASAAGRDWLSSVRIDLEAMGYAVGASDLCAAGVGAPHIRQRLWWGGYSGWTTASARDWKDTAGMECEAVNPDGTERSRIDQLPRQAAQCGWLADTERTRPAPGVSAAKGRYERDAEVAGNGSGRRIRLAKGESQHESMEPRSSAYNEIWRDADWLYGRDGRWRPVRSGTFTLGHGLSARVVRLRGYGNAIVPQVAQAFIESFCEAVEEASCPK